MFRRNIKAELVSFSAPFFNPFFRSHFLTFRISLDFRATLPCGSWKCFRLFLDTAKGIRSSDLALDALKDNIMILSLQYVFRRKQGYQQTYRSCKTLSGGWGKLTLFPPGSLSGNSPGCCRTAAGNIWRSRTYFCSRHARRSRAQTSACRTGVLLPSPYAHS